jgi:RNA polymerase sigma factor (sigma-70 family)
MKTATLNAVVGFVRRLSERDAGALSDGELLERFQRQRSEAAFGELVRRHGAMVLSTCRRVLRHEQDAEDAFQAAFLVLARKAGSIRHSAALGGWLHQVAHRIARRARDLVERRREQYRPMCEDIVAATRRDVLDEDLEGLPEPYRAVLVLCYLEGRTQAEAARMLETTPAGVNSRLKRARELLRKQWNRGQVVPAVLASVAGAHAAAPAALVRLTIRAAVNFAANTTIPCEASALAVSLANGAISTMHHATIKFLSAVVFMAAVLAAGFSFGPASALGDDPTALPALAAQPKSQSVAAKPKPADKAKPARSCIILWMSGGPSQIDTFDPKAGAVSLFPAIDTAVKGLQFSQTVPQLAKQAKHLAVIRSMTHREADHARGSHLMRTGYTSNNVIDYPSLGSVLAKELGDGRPKVPVYFTISAQQAFVFGGAGPGILGARYAPLVVGGGGFGKEMPLIVPPVADFEDRAKGKGEAHKKAVAKAFDLDDEKKEVRDAYGRSRFGDSCLLARRLVDRGVPVVEVVMGGWDVHGNAAQAMPNLTGELDTAMTALIKDLEASKRLENTLIVWMGEFGRTPRVNNAGGRDHWTAGFSVVLAGCGIKGGQVIGKTSADATKVEQRPVSPAEFFATIYQALGVDPAKENIGPGERKVRLVEKGASAVKEVLR